MVTEVEVDPPNQTPEPPPETSMEDVQKNEETPLAVNDETLSDTLIDDELLPLMLN